MSAARYLTHHELSLLSQATEGWLRLRDVELNLGESALSLLRKAILRSPQCARQDIASINWTVDAKFRDSETPVALTLVEPARADIKVGRVSVLSAIGLALIGHALGAAAQVPLASGRTVEARLIALRPSLPPWESDGSS